MGIGNPRVRGTGVRQASLGGVVKERKGKQLERERVFIHVEEVQTGQANGNGSR